MKLNFKFLFFNSLQISLVACLFVSLIYSAANSDYHTQVTKIKHHKNEELRVFKDQHTTRLHNITQAANNQLEAVNRKTKLLINDARTIKDTRNRNATIKQISRNAAQAYRDIKAQRKTKTAAAIKLHDQQLDASAKRHNDQLVNLKKAHAQVTRTKHATTNTNTKSKKNTKNKPKQQSITGKSDAPKVIPVTPKSIAANSKSSSQTRQRAFSNFTAIKTN